MSESRPPRGRFKWLVWAGIVTAVALPAACVIDRGELPGYLVPAGR